MEIKQKRCELLIEDEVNCTFNGLDVATRRACSDKLKFFVQSARHTPMFKLGRWDGYIRYFHNNGNTYVNLLDQVLPIIMSSGYEVDIVDEREAEGPFEFGEITEDYITDHAPNAFWPPGHPHEGEPIKLRPHQVTALQKFSENIHSLQEISTGAGKTILSSCMSLMAEPYGKTLVIVPSRDLVNQTKKDYELLGLDVGVYYGKTKETDKKHTIATWQSIESWKKDKICKTTGKNIGEFSSELSAVIIDECQGLKAKVLQTLLADTFADVPIRWGISGTIPKEEEIFNGLLAMVGPIVNSVTARSLMDKDVLSDCDIHMIQTKDTGEFNDFHEEMTYLVSDSDRLDWYAGFIKEVAKSGNTLVLFGKINTGEELKERIPESSLVHGVIKSEDRIQAYEDVNDNDNQIVLASYGVASTGINIPRIFNLILIEPGKSFVRVIQSIGRSIRRAKDKDHANVYDISSSLKYSKKHMKARQKLYDEAQYPYELQKIDMFKQLESNDFRVIKKTKSED